MPPIDVPIAWWGGRPYLVYLHTSDVTGGFPSAKPTKVRMLVLPHSRGFPALTIFSSKTYIPLNHVGRTTIFVSYASDVPAGFSPAKQTPVYVCSPKKTSVLFCLEGFPVLTRLSSLTPIILSELLLYTGIFAPYQGRDGRPPQANNSMFAKMPSIGPFWYDFCLEVGGFSC